MKRMIKMENQKKKKEILKLCPCNCTKKIDASKKQENILFDEKMGGTVHMAIGQSYLQAGGKNQSSIHWDMITDMTDGGSIYADDEKIYENGQFLF